MRKSNRNAKTLAILTAAAGFGSYAQLAHATSPIFTWANSAGTTFNITGSWSAGTNWAGGAAPVAGGGSNFDLTFRSNNATSYTSTNDLAGSFGLDIMRFNTTNASAGSITVQGTAAAPTTTGTLNFTGGDTAIQFNQSAGTQRVTISNPMNFGGDSGNAALITTINNLGGTTGAATFGGALGSTVAAAPNNGAALNFDRNNGTTNINGGGLLYAVRVNQGQVTMNGGSLQLTSAQREADIFGGDNIGDSTSGYWALGVGNTSNDSTFTMNGGVLVAEDGMAAINPGTKGAMNFTNNAVATFLTQGTIATGRFGVNAGTGTINVTGGAQVICRLADLGRQEDRESDFAFLNISGTGSKLTSAQFLASRNGGNATINISNGGVLSEVGGGQTEFGSPRDSLGAPFDGDASMNIDGAGSGMVCDFLVAFGGANGSATLTLTNSATLECSTEMDYGFANTGRGTLSINSGSHVTVHGNVFADAGGGSTLSLNGATSSFTSEGQFIMGSVTTAGDMVSVTGGTMTTNTDGLSGFYISVIDNTVSNIKVDGANSHFVVQSIGFDADTVNGNPQYADISGGVDSVTNINVTNGGEFVIDADGTGNGTVLGDWSGSKTTVTVSGAGSRFSIGTATTDFARITADATLNISAGATVSISSAVMTMAALADWDVDNGTIAAETAGHANVSVDGAGSRLDIAGQIIAGGNFVDDDSNPLPGGRTSISVTNGGALTAAGLFMSNNPPVGPTAGDGDTTLSIQGTGSSATFDPGDGSGIVLMGVGTMSNSTISVGAGAKMTVQGAAGLFNDAAPFGGFAAASGFQSKSVVTNAGTITVVGDSIVGWDGAATFTNSGTFTSTTLTMGINGIDDTAQNGAGTFINSGTMNITNELDVGILGLGSLSNTGTINVGSNMFVGSSAGPVSGGVVNITGGTLNVGNQLQIGGAGGTLGGASVLNLSNGTLNILGNAGTAGLLSVYSNSTMTIGSYVKVVGDTTVDGHLLYNSGTFNTTGELNTTGSIILSSANRTGVGTLNHPTNLKVVEAGSLTFLGYTGVGTLEKATGGQIDVKDNDMLLHGMTAGVGGAGSLDVGMLIRSGKTTGGGGSWTGAGIVSTSARGNALGITNLGAITGQQYKTAAAHTGTTQFDGRPLANTDVVVKYTYNGDTDLDGRVTGSDYAKIDAAFGNQHTAGNIGGWNNGDYNYDGRIDGSDYALMDAAFGSQGLTVLGRTTDLPGNPGVFNYNFVSTGMDGADARSTNITGKFAKQFTDVRYSKLHAGIQSSVENGGQVDDGGGNVSKTLAEVPEPSVLGLTGLGMLGALARRRRAAR